MSVLDRFRLDGDVALVTGAAGGIGSAFAEAMVEAGADAALVDVDEEGLASVADELRSNTDAHVLALHCDVSDEEAVDDAVDETVTELDGLDVAFANAGISTSVGSVTHADMQQWHDLLDVDLTGVFHTDRAAGAYMKANDGGKIVNTASILGFKGSQIPGQVAYCAAKGGVVQVTRQLAAELGPNDVRVNAIAPGWIDTDMTGGLAPRAQRRRRWRPLAAREPARDTARRHPGRPQGDRGLSRQRRIALHDGRGHPRRRRHVCHGVTTSVRSHPR